MCITCRAHQVRKYRNFYMTWGTMDDDSCTQPVGRCAVFYYGVGHMLNDVTSACWFTYLLIFLTDIGLPPRFGLHWLLILYASSFIYFFFFMKTFFIDSLFILFFKTRRIVFLFIYLSSNDMYNKEVIYIYIYINICWLWKKNCLVPTLESQII